MNEHQWIQSIRKGKKEHLKDIAAKYYDDIYRFCAFQTGNREDAYDLTQETFLRFIRYIESYHDRNLKGYLLTIAMNVCRSYLSKKRTNKTVLVPFDDTRQQTSEFWQNPSESWQQTSDIRPPSLEQQTSESPEKQAVRKDIHDRLMHALSLLPEMQREAILLHYLQNMKYKEIAKRTDVSVSTVKSRVRQGVVKLQELLREEDFLIE